MRGFCLATTLLILISGCHVVPLSLGTRQSLANCSPHTAPQSLSREQSANSPHFSQITPASYTSDDSEPSVELDLATAIVTALERNPDLVAQRAGEPAAQALVNVAQTYPFNPTAEVEVRPYGREQDGGSASVTNAVTVMQTFELAHQRRHRIAGGIANLSRIQWTIAQAELQTAAQAERLFFTALYLRELRDQARALAELNDHLVGVTQRRFESGQATAADAATVKIEAQSSRQQYALAEANYQTSLLDLRLQINLPLDVPLNVVGNLTDFEWESVFGNNPASSPSSSSSSLSSMIDTSAEDGRGAGRSEEMASGDVEQFTSIRPDVLAAREDVATAQAALRLASADRVQNLTMGPMYERDDAGTLFFGIKSQVNIPVANTGLPLVRQRQAELHQKLVIAEQLAEKARLEATAAINRYERGRRLVERARSEKLGELPDQLQQFQDLFEAGQIDVLHVFTARTSLIQTRRAYLDSLKELALAAADVTAVTGLPPDDFIDMQPKQTIEPTPEDGDAQLLPSPR